MCATQMLTQVSRWLRFVLLYLCFVDMLCVGRSFLSWANGVIGKNKSAGKLETHVLTKILFRKSDIQKQNTQMEGTVTPTVTPL